MPFADRKRFLIVSNRLPIIVDRIDEHLVLSPASGGLITALNPLLKECEGVWIGWIGTTNVDENEVMDLLKEQQKKVRYSLKPIFLTDEEVKLFYAGFSNEILWPLFHDLQSECHFDSIFWKSYQEVNQKFAKYLASEITDHDFVWIQDYHLILVARYLRDQGIKKKLTFFLHTPFAALDIFMKIPWRSDLLLGMLAYDFIGVQSKKDLSNFLQCVDVLLPGVSIEHFPNHAICSHNDRNIYVGAFPISIDYHEFFNLARSLEIENKVKAIKEALNGRKVIFSVDRLDYTKGIPQRLDGIQCFLDKNPDMHEKVTFVQFVVPSRTEIIEYHQLKEKIDRKVSEINSQFTKDGWVPIHYMFYPISRTELVAYYRAAEVLLVTPIKDGMNLVAKEYIASNVEESGVVILSEFTGAACQLKKDALLINPYDIEGIADAIAFALKMPLEDRRQRMHVLRKHVKENDIYRWINQIIHASNGSVKKDLL